MSLQAMYDNLAAATAGEAVAEPGVAGARDRSGVHDILAQAGASAKPCLPHKLRQILPRPSMSARRLSACSALTFGPARCCCGGRPRRGNFAAACCRSCAARHVAVHAAAVQHRRSGAALDVVEDPAPPTLPPVFAGTSPHGSVTIYAKGEGAAQLARLGVNALALAEPFDAAALLAQTRPALVLVGTSEDPDAAAHDLVAACRAAHVPTVGFVDGPANIERRFRGRGEGPLAFAPDAVLVPAEDLRDQLIAAGFAPERAFVVEHPHFARLAGERRRLDAVGRDALRARLFPNCPTGRPVLVFLAERSGGLAAERMVRGPGYRLTGRGGDARRTNIVLEEVLDAAGAPCLRGPISCCACTRRTIRRNSPLMAPRSI